MPKQPNTVRRILVPLIAALLGALVVYAVFQNSGGAGTPPADPRLADAEPRLADSEPGTTPAGADSAAPDPRETQTDTQPAAADPGPRVAAPGATPGADQSATAAEGSPEAPVRAANIGEVPGPQAAEGDRGDRSPPPPTLRARRFPVEASPFAPLGGGEGYYFEPIQFTRVGAGILRLALQNEQTDPIGGGNIVLQERRVSADQRAAIPPFSFVRLLVRSPGNEWQDIDLAGGVNALGEAAVYWNELDTGVFEAVVEDASGEAYLRIVREFSISPGSYDISIDQRIENLSRRVLEVQAVQFGAVDLPPSRASYGGDKRRLRFGVVDPGSSFIYAEPGLRPRTAKEVLGRQERVPTADGRTVKRYPARYDVWPVPRAEERGERLVWYAFTGRFFAVAVHGLVGPDAPIDQKLLDEAETIDRLVLDPFSRANDVQIGLRMQSRTYTLDPGGVQPIGLGVYAGPLSQPIIAAEPLASSLGLPELVVYNFGGFCAGCTFQWLTDLLMVVLRFFHSFLYDWSLAIILLVVVVRTILHPVTRWSQIRVQRFGAQMQAMAPKMTKVKERYADDPKRQQQEVAKLWREEGINPAGMLGCLPMFLQSPIWIALYATLFFAYELYHAPAFYGVIQAVAPNWPFLADLSAPDRLIPLPASMHLDLGIVQIDSINLLPFLLGLVFYGHQKFLTPPSTATLTPEQQQQQKMIKIMMVVMFPVFMYAAPSGLALYFITNSSLAIIENKWIRAHLDKHELLDVEKMKADREAKRTAKGGSWWERMQQRAELYRQMQSAKGSGGPPPGMSKRQQAAYKAMADRREQKNRKFKKRD